MYFIYYIESERGWGQKYWHGGTGFETYKEAKDAFDKEMDALPTDHVPAYYIMPLAIEKKVDGGWVKVDGE